MSKLRILHLFSNWKWTGPAEPAVLIAAAHRRLGHEVTFACGRPVRGCENEVAREARARGVEPTEGLRLSKHRKPLANMLDRGPLRRLIRAGSFDALCVHQANDHDLGATAARSVRPGLPVIRVIYDGEMPPADARSRRLFGEMTDGLVVFGERLAEGFRAEHGLARGLVVRSDPPTDLARYDPDRPLPDVRPELGLGPEDLVLGIVARIQKHRRYELLFEAMRRAARRAPRLRLMIVGRGTHEETLAHGPASHGELRDRVVLAGYRRGDDYVAALAAMDAKIFLVPGTDGTCRAAREAMAMGLPVVTTRRGLLPEIVEEGITGLLVDEDPDALSAAFLRLAAEDGFRQRLADRARARARHRFDPDRSARAVENLARRAIERRRKSPNGS